MSKTRMIGGFPSYWTDETWITHSCEADELEPGIYYIWTDCGRDVPPHAANTAEPGDSVSCANCLAAAPNGSEATTEAAVNFV